MSTTTSYTLAHFAQDLRYGIRARNLEKPEFLDTARELVELFDAPSGKTAVEHRGQFPEYIDYLRHTVSLDTAIERALEFHQHNAPLNLVAVTVFQCCRRQGDFERACLELRRLHYVNPQDLYVSHLYGQSLAATARLQELHWLAEVARNGLRPQDNHSFILRWARLLTDVVEPEKASAFLETVPDALPGTELLRARLGTYGSTDRPASPAIPTTVINLTVDRRKWDVSAELLERAGHHPGRLDAVDGRLLPDYALHACVSTKQMASSLGAGAVACALSHIKAWEQLAASPDDHWIITEDDAAPYTHRSALDARLESLGEFDIVYVNERMSGVYANGANPPKEPFLDTWDQLASWAPGRTGWGFDGYMMSRRGAEKAVELLDRHGILGHIDGQLGAYSLAADAEPSGSAQRLFAKLRAGIDDRHQLRSVCLAMPITFQNNFGHSTIGTVSRDRGL